MKKKFSNRYIFWIAWRYLIVKKKGSGLSFMTTVSILGVAIGVMVLIIVLSVMGGFGDEWHRKMLNGTPHLEIVAKDSLFGFSLKKYPQKDIVKQFDHVVVAQPYVQSDVILKYKKYLQPVVLFGINPNEKNYPWSFGKENNGYGKVDLTLLSRLHSPMISEDDTQYPGIILGEGLAQNLNVISGDKITVLNPSNMVGSNAVLTDGVISKQYVVVGTFETGSMDYDNKWAITSIDNARKFLLEYDPSLDIEEYVSGIAINIEDPFTVSGLKNNLKTSDNRFEGLKVLNWQDLNSALLFALKLEKYTMGSILMLIVLVAAFSISCTLMMTVHHKRYQLSLLRAIGMSKDKVVRLFLYHGLVIATVGILLGLICGVGICFLISSFKFIALPESMYYLRYLPVKFIPGVYVVICICAWFLSLIAAVYPAYIGANKNPSEGLNG